MLTPTLALVVTLGAPPPCPKEFGQIRWEGYEHLFADGGRQRRLLLSVWDRDTDGKPSDGDVARASGDGVDETWFVLQGALARDLAAKFKRAGDALQTTCESRFEVNDVPKVASNAALGRLLAGQRGGAAPEISRDEQVRGQMAGWADEWCRGKAGLNEQQLAAKLAARAAESGAGLPKARLRGIASDVAKEKALACARLEGSGFTFP